MAEPLCCARFLRPGLHTHLRRSCWRRSNWYFLLLAITNIQVPSPDSCPSQTLLPTAQSPPSPSPSTAQDPHGGTALKPNTVNPVWSSPSIPPPKRPSKGTRPTVPTPPLISSLVNLARHRLPLLLLLLLLLMLLHRLHQRVFRCRLLRRRVVRFRLRFLLILLLRLRSHGLRDG